MTENSSPRAPIWVVGSTLRACEIEVWARDDVRMYELALLARVGPDPKVKVVFVVSFQG